MNKSDWIDYNLDMINFFIHELLKFINKYNKEFTLNTDLETFYENFSDFLYNNYYLNLEFKDYTDYDRNYDRNFEYFESMYDDNIIDLFSEFKDIAIDFTSDIFKLRNESYSLLEFIYNNINLEQDYNILNDDLEEEYIEEEYY
tara:strand:+ start:742 stop:1173 length:432 start_codon:yes stop_codon:yes gene_type:complete